MGKITRDKEHLVPEPKFTPLPEGGQSAEIFVFDYELHKKFDQLKPQLTNSFLSMKKFSDVFQENYVRLFSQIESSFLTNVWQYFFDSNYYPEWAQKNYLMNDLLDKRMNAAKEMLIFINNDKTVDKESPSIKQFIDRWRDDFRDQGISV